MVEKKDVANKNSHSLLELMPLVKRDELIRLIKKIIELQETGTLDKLLDILDKMSKKGVIDDLYLKVNDLCEKNTLKKLMEGNTLDRQIEALTNLLTDGSLMKLLDLVIELQKKGLIDELMNYVPKLMILLEKLVELEKKGVIKWNDISKMIDKFGELLSSGALNTAMDMLDILPVALSSLNSEPVRNMLKSNVPKIVELLQKLAEMNEKGMLNIDKVTSILEKLMQLVNDGTVDKLLELLVMLSAMLDAFNDEMIKSIGEKAGKLLELLEPSKL